MATARSPSSARLSSARSPASARPAAPARFSPPLLALASLLAAARAARAPTPGATLVVAPCDASSAAQQFTVDNAGLGVIIPFTDPNSVCLSAHGGDLSFQQCAGGDAEELGWSLKSGAKLAPVAWNATGLCWAGTAPGEALTLAPCGPASASYAHDAATQMISVGGSAPPACVAVANAPRPLLAQYVFADGMVLQQDAPVTLFGFGAAANATVVASLGAARGSAVADASGAWSVELSAQPRGGPFNLSAVSDGVVQTVVDIWLGLVFFCSGQSNLSGGNTPLSYVYNASEEIAATANFSRVRIFSEGTASQGAAQPLSELEFAPLIPWSVASPASTPGFSGVCWLAGKRVAEVLGPAQPIGLVEAAWGGTSQQVWMPPEALSPCAPTPASYPGGWPLVPSSLFNSMVSPLLNFRLAGVVWYQGESNALSPAPSYGAWYTCALPQLISSWRARFRSPRAWWGTVQLSTWAGTDPSLNDHIAEARDVELRAASDAGLAHTTTATGVDGGDPSGSIHTRCKLDLGRRLGNGFLFDAGALASSAFAAGPIFASSAAGGGAAGAMSATVRFQPPFDAAGSLALVAPGADDGELCTSPSFVSTSCPPGINSVVCRGFELQDSASGAWFNATAALSAAGDALVLTAVGAPAGATANATSSGWAQWPISLLYGAEGNVAAFPWQRAIA